MKEENQVILNLPKKDDDSPDSRRLSGLNIGEVIEKREREQQKEKLSKNLSLKVKLPELQELRRTAKVLVRDDRVIARVYINIIMS